jgi:3-oxocholest-4-en-26-oate---CoA ligase
MPEFALADLFEIVAREVPDRECIVQGPRRLRYAEVRERATRLASWFVSQGLGGVRERAELEPWESGQDHVALYLHNCPEYIESMLACFRARLVPCNVNYRYAVPELISLLRDAGARALVYHAAFEPQVEAVRAALPELRVSIRVNAPDDPRPPPTAAAGVRPLAAAGVRPLAAAGVIDYDAALAAGDPAGPSVKCAPDDLYILYTGGTTGSPKGVLWRQADIYLAALGGRDLRGIDLADLAELRERAAKGCDRAMPLSPLMHGAAHWVALRALYNGDTVVLSSRVRSFDPDETIDTIAREGVQVLTLVGDAFGRPLLEALERRRPELPTLRAIVNGGAPLGAATKRALLACLPGRVVVDAIGSSESGQQGVDISTDANAQTGRFERARSTRVLSADRRRVLSPGETELGWLAQSGRVPLGYLGDLTKTRATFPVLDGVRWAVPGDRAYMLADGRLDVVGRDSATINSGGEKIFAEEVEAVLKTHPDVYDVLVCSRPSARWGQEVCAILQLRAAERSASIEADLLAHAGRELARYKLPRVFVFCERIERSPSGKPDYVWARRLAAAAPGGDP